MGERDDLTEEEKAKLVAAKILKQKEKNRMHYRINGIRSLTGGRRVEPALPERLEKILEKTENRDENESAEESDLLVKQKAVKDLSEGGRKAVVEFAASSYAILENEKICKILIERYGNIHSEVSFRVETIDGTATAGEDYNKIDEIKTMTAGQIYLSLDVIIIDDDQWEPDETFFVKISPHSASDNMKIGQKGICMVTIINDDGNC